MAHPAHPIPEYPTVAMRMSTLFLRTLREDPADAEVPSHRLLVRAGYIRRVAPGIYTWLPLGLKILRRVEQIVREEMDAIGAQELLFPALLPREPYEASGRWTEYGDNIFRLKDRKGADYLLGPTHEELFALTVKDLYSSYKDLPVTLYQIQNKYRDEARPRAGILRGREFVMKDAYSFDVDDAGLQKSYDQQREAYTRIFDRLGFHYVIVEAMAGAMGGSKSEEFLATAENGEDTYVRCPNCGYAANVEAVRVPVPPALDWTDAPAAHVEDTPETPTIATLVDHLNARFPRDDRPWAAGDTLKNVLVTVTAPDGTQEILAIGLPGDREVDEKRLGAQLEPSVAAVFEDFEHHTELVKGYIGPGVLGADKPAGVRYLVDPRVVDGTRWVTGADQPGRHVVDLVAGRDFTADGTIEAAEVRAGDECPSCGHQLEAARGIEMGHIFQLGRKYAEALGLEGPRRDRQARDRHHGLLRGRRLPGRRGHRRGQLRRARALLAPGDHAGRRARRGDRQGRRGLPQGAGDRPRARGRGPGGHLRRPQAGQPGREVQGLRAHRGPDDRRRRPRSGRRHHRGQGPAFGGAPRRPGRLGGG